MRCLVHIGVWRVFVWMRPRLGVGRQSCSLELGTSRTQVKNLPDRRYQSCIHAQNVGVLKANIFGDVILNWQSGNWTTSTPQNMRNSVCG